MLQKTNFFFKWIWLKYSNEKFDDLSVTPKTSETKEITADDSMLIQFSTKTTKVLYNWRIESN